jgi:hypothetical protein
MKPVSKPQLVSLLSYANRFWLRACPYCRGRDWWQMSMAGSEARCLCLLCYRTIAWDHNSVGLCRRLIK